MLGSFYKYFADPDSKEVREHVENDLQEEAETIIEREEYESTGEIPKLNIVILIVGSRGDVQPFIALGRGLQAYGHRVRLCSHINFRQFVTENGLEYYPLKGNPEVLMNFMVNHPDMITIDPNEIKQSHDMMDEIYCSTWDACTGLDFTPDVIISNPPVHVHVHLMQRLQIPLYIMFTMPWSATKDYMHPLAPAQKVLDNKMSYTVVDSMIWTGLGPLQNEFRKKLGLHSIVKGASLVKKLKIPQLYCMSSHLAPKPTDWGPHIDVVGFWFLDLKSNFTPPQDLVEFLKSGTPPIYIGFGSIVVDDPKKLSEQVIQGIIKSGERALVSSGWAKIGVGMDLPPTIKLIGNAPHDWLFSQCAAVCHHGGAGTLAAGLKAGCPTIVVPFFGDQNFWGTCVSRMGVGPDPIHNKKLTADKLAEAIKFCMTPEVKQKAKELGEKLLSENGVENAIKSFHKKLPVVEGSWQVSIHENQRKLPLLGYSTNHLGPTDPYAYTDVTSTLHLERDRYQLPNGWSWTSDWTPKVVQGETDKDGWKYAHSFFFQTRENKWQSEDSLLSMVRTRQLIRQRRKIPDSIPVPATSKQLVYVDILEGKELPNLDVIGQSDPFCVLRVEGRDDICKQITSVKNGTLNPVWKETLWAQVNPNDEIVVDCWDQDPVGKDFIGNVRFKANDLLLNEIGKEGKFYPLQNPKLKNGAGQIKLAFTL
eukprot:TRINITY_DN6167_c0_g1_i1.p1 TRINITY_DN6167_c0_g1~~TRINITY_DN6167_c0_g1_i1.p1  ORF type:complete len:704 (-),score=129.97 TRINITY_DN6167_c0_g1_i1:139-2250(-)